MSFGSAGYTPTFSGDLTSALAEGAARRTKKALDKLRKALRRKRISKKLEERRKARTPEKKKEAEKIAVLEEKEDLQEEKEVQKELVQEEKKEVTAQQKLLPASRSSAIVSNRVVPVTVREEQRKSITPAQKLLPAAGSRQAISGSAGPVGGGLSTVVITDPSGKQTTSAVPAEKTGLIRSAARKGGGISSESFFNQAQTGVSASGEYLTKEQRRAAFIKSREASSQLVKRNNDAIISAIKGEVSNVRSAVIDVASETTESKNVMSTLVKQEEDQTNVFKKQAQVLDDALQFKKRSLRKQEIFLKQQEGKKKQDLTGAAALVGGGAALGAGFGGGGLPGGGLANLGLLAPLGAAAGLFRRGVENLGKLRQNGSAIGQRLSNTFRRGRNFLGRQFGAGRDFLGRQLGRGANYWNRFTNLMQRRMFGLNQYTSPIGPMPLDSGPRGLGGWARAAAGEVGDVFGNVPRLQSSVQAGTPSKPTRKPSGRPPVLSKLQAKAGGVIDKIFDLVPGLKGLREKMKGLTLKKAVGFLNGKVLGTINGIKKGGNFVAKGALKLASPVINPFVKGLGLLTKLVSGPAKFLSGVFKPIFKAGAGLARVLGPILEIGTFALDTKSRLDSGYSPARAILPLIPRTLLTMGGAALGGTIGAAGGPLSILGAMGGGFLGSLLGDQVVKFIDGTWNTSWDNSIFKDFNEGSYQLLSEKLGYEPPRSEQEALDRRIEQEAAAAGNDPRQYEGYSGAFGDASMQAPEAPSQGGFASRLLDAASRHIYSPYGMRNGREHKGLDISGGPYKLGTPLASKIGGRVAMAEDLGRSGWGKYVVLNHANGTSSLYGHLSKYFVKRGDTVEPGEIIGNIGSTGRSEGPHLHFELGSGWNGGVITGHVNPKDYIDQYVSAANGGGAAGADAVSFNAPSGTQSQTIASALNTDMYSGGAQQTIAVQLPPTIYPMQDGNVDNPGGPTLERVNNELLYLQNVEQRVLVG